MLRRGTFVAFCTGRGSGRSLKLLVSGRWGGLVSLNVERIEGDEEKGEEV